MKQLLKTAIVGYCTYKVINKVIDDLNKKKEEEKYVPFDEIVIVEPKQDTTKNVAMFIGGLTLGLAIKPTKKILEQHYICYFK